ncbi:hypothetical protein QZH56_36850 [Streptomyces olivoreticuli]|uniref:hypothetical protein n=1 Tax=Streptomyces olivoreticuli TaxID=68246 RepID=UPI002658A4DC|nr:hypothetical protein [Streptomyces olivoreticuli]WKK24147.1 hypothetical protein QZH56_36850 [Streptomyces olivoreticuli]
MTVNHAASLPPEAVPLGMDLCPRCDKRPIKLAGTTVWLCIHCYADEKQLQARRAAASQSFVAANFATPVCMACESNDVDADGYRWWCRNCRAVSRVRRRK